MDKCICLVYFQFALKQNSLSKHKPAANRSSTQTRVHRWLTKWEVVVKTYIKDLEWNSLVVTVCVKCVKWRIINEHSGGYLFFRNSNWTRSGRVRGEQNLSSLRQTGPWWWVRKKKCLQSHEEWHRYVSSVDVGSTSVAWRDVIARTTFLIWT